MLLKSTRQMAADAKFYESYSRFNEELGRYENWNESVERVMNMHKAKYKDKLTPELLELMDFVQTQYNKKLILGAQRALQFGGEQLLKHEFKMYNCTSSHLDRIEFFGECMYLLLCGAGVGFSVQHHHIEKLPTIYPRTNRVSQFVIEDSIEGWSAAIDALFSSFLKDGGKLPQYNGKKVYFDFSLIRPKGSPISGGFKAPGPEPLRKCIAICEEILTKIAYGTGRIKSIEAYDLSMHIADAVISGGVRRAATIALFSPDDEDMLASKTGKWNVDNPQRARSNNSIILQRDETSKQDLENVVKYIKQFGEPGFILTDDKEFTFNPCVEIGMYPKTEDGRSGFQACNLCEINGMLCSDEQTFYDACKAAAILGTLQAGYTNFKYISDATREIVEKEALLGVSITGWMNSPNILFDQEVMIKGAEIVKEWNAIVAPMININQAARTTCVKPSGNASVLLQTASGIHCEHTPTYLRHIQMNKGSKVAKIIAEKYPEMIENSVWSTSGSDYCIAFPVVSPKTSIYKQDLLGVKQLDYIKKAQQYWVEYGTNVDLCVKPSIRHNVSNTVTVDDWDAVIDYIYENKAWFAGISFIPLTGDKDFAQAPNASVLSESEIVEKYGAASMFASGLICQGLDAFDNDLWLALSTAAGYGLDISEDTHANSAKREFVKRLDRYSTNYFAGDMPTCISCLKDVYYLHKWEKIQHAIKDSEIDWDTQLTEAVDIDIDTMGAIACSGVTGCEI